MHNVDIRLGYHSRAFEVFGKHPLVGLDWSPLASTKSLQPPYSYSLNR
jgi:hypothetical protein